MSINDTHGLKISYFLFYYDSILNLDYIGVGDQEIAVPFAFKQNLNGVASGHDLRTNFDKVKSIEIDFS